MTDILRDIRGNLRNRYLYTDFRRLMRPGLEDDIGDAVILVETVRFLTEPPPEPVDTSNNRYLQNLANRLREEDQQSTPDPSPPPTPPSESESEDEEEREARFRREHQQSLETAEAYNQHLSFEFTDLTFNHFWEENKKNFLDGTYNITYGFLGIEKIVRVTEETENIKINSYKTFPSDVCVLCLDEKAVIDVLFANCGHLCCCSSCFANYTKNDCPVCKTVNPIIREI